jgi:regulator of protease activity HflC (stomatin/prohibitin superfamily)
MSYGTFKVFFVVALLCLIGYIGAITLMYEWIPAGHVGVMYSNRTGLIREEIPPKRVRVPWLHKLYIYPKTLKAAKYVNTVVDGKAVNNAVQIATSDNSTTSYDVVVFYRAADVVKIIDNFKPIPVEEVESVHIARALKEAANAVGTRYTAFQLMGSKREEASIALTQELSNRISSKGIAIEAALLCQAYPSAQLQAKITGQVNAITELTIAEIRSQIAEQTKQAAITRATAENKARTLTASTTTEKSNAMLALEADEAALRRWDGQLPLLEGKPGQTIFVPDSLAARAATKPRTPESTETPEEDPTAGGNQ